MKSITIDVLNKGTGEIQNTEILLKKNNNTRFPVKGLKMYLANLPDMVDLLTKRELKILFNLYADDNLVTRAGIIKVPFKNLTEKFDVSDRSKFKRKLLEHNILMVYRNKLMLNPFIFTPRNDKNIENFQWKVQQIYKYLGADTNIYFDEIDNFVNTIFGKK